MKQKSFLLRFLAVITACIAIFAFTACDYQDILDKHNITINGASSSSNSYGQPATSSSINNRPALPHEIFYNFSDDKTTIGGTVLSNNKTFGIFTLSSGATFKNDAYKVCDSNGYVLNFNSYWECSASLTQPITISFDAVIGGDVTLYASTMSTDAILQLENSLGSSYPLYFEQLNDEINKITISITDLASYTISAFTVSAPIKIYAIGFDSVYYNPTPNTSSNSSSNSTSNNPVPNVSVGLQVTHELNLSDLSAVASNTYFTFTGELIDKTTSGKTAKDGWLNGYKFTSFKQSSKCTIPQYGVKGIQFTTTGRGTVYVYAARGSTAVLEGDMVLINSSSTVIDTVHPTEYLTCFAMTIPSAGSYQIGCGSTASSINIYAIMVVSDYYAGTQNSASYPNAYPTPSPSYSSSSPIYPVPPASSNSCELNLSDLAAVESNTYFTLTADLVDKTTSGKTAKDGWLNGYTFTCFKQSSKCTIPQYGVKGILFTTTGPATVYVYATRGSSGVLEGDMVLIDSNNNVIETVHPTENLTCFAMTIPSAGSYQIGSGSQASSINIFAIKVA